MFGIGVGAMALVCVLSAFNGIERLVEGLYSSFDPDVRIEAKMGKTFEWKTFPKSELAQVKGVAFISRSLEETVFLKYRDAQYFATLKGVDDSYLKMSELDSMIYDGNAVLQKGENHYVMLGYGVADQLSVFLSHAFEPIKVYSANKKAKSGNMHDGFMTDLIFPSAIFSVNPEYDFKYVVAPYAFAEKLLQEQGNVSSVELGLESNYQTETIDNIKRIVGGNFTVKTKYELNELLYQTNKTEKWATFLILSFILLIAAFNLIGSLTVLIIDKGRDIKVLQSMGAHINQIKELFILEGLLVSLCGGIGGIILGLLLCLLQKHVGLIKLQEGTIAEYYPIDLEVMDFVAVFLVVCFIGAIASFLPANFVVRRYRL
jgi:ABC-type lipoprotein release transport system permease subunit